MKVLLLGDRHIEDYEAVLKHLNVDYDSIDNMQDLAIYDKLIIPGGIDVNPKRYGEQRDETVVNVDDDWDEFQFKTLAYFVEHNKPVLGICRGMQLINVFFKGTLIQDIKTDIKHPSIKDYKIDRYHYVNNTGLAKELFGERVKVNSSHHQAVKDVAEGFEVISRCDDNIIESMVNFEKAIYCVQWHPERTTLKYKKDDVADGMLVYKTFIEL